MSNIKRHVVHWTDIERMQVFSQIPELITESWPKLLKRVMEVLPLERRRTLAYSSRVHSIRNEYKEWLKENPRFERPKGSLMGTPPPVQEATEKSAETFPPPEIIVVERVVKEQPDYGCIPTSTLARILLERLALMDQFDRRFREMEDMIRAKNLAEKEHDMRLGPSPPPEPVKEREIRIAIVGPLDSQAREIEARTTNTPKPIQLRFYDKDRSSNTQAMGSVDYAIVTRHCNHMWWDRMKQALPADRVFFVDSGIQSVVQKVYDITARRDA